GNIVDQKIQIGPGYQVQFSEAVRKTGILTSAVGMITSTEQAITILNENKADFILFGREILRNPYFALKTEDAEWPSQYLRAK
ncbi:MAG: oxidoreductase, partial [Bacteroidota bacterium]